jgi:hypothetical protein
VEKYSQRRTSTQAYHLEKNMTIDRHKERIAGMQKTIKVQKTHIQENRKQRDIHSLLQSVKRADSPLLRQKQIETENVKILLCVFP